MSVLGAGRPALTMMTRISLDTVTHAKNALPGPGSLSAHRRLPDWHSRNGSRSPFSRNMRRHRMHAYERLQRGGSYAFVYKA